MQPGMTGGDPTRVAGRRIIGYFLDTVIDDLVLLTLISVMGVKLTANPVVGTFRPGEDQAAAGFATALIIFFVYYVVSKVLMLGFLGATPGMFMVSVRCVRWDGRPCGIWRAFVRTLIMGVISQLGSLFLGGATIMMWYSKGHKSPGDYVAGTYVIDSMYKGRLIMESLDEVLVGPPSVTREEAQAYMAAQAQASGITSGFVPPLTAQAKSGEPFLDKNLDTYVVWNAKQSAWLAFDKGTGAWHRIG